ncbi:MAG: plasmid pRiA4b ORF-3 family protein [Desulfovibrio sp.]|nr:plasmid pRiA4b ORF-3 family protein [Desulfovibrio sp.]
MPTQKTFSNNNVCIRLRITLLSGMGTDFEDDNIVRVIDMRAKHTLDQLHAMIFKIFDRDDEHMYEFTFGADRPYSSKAIRYGIPIDDGFSFPNETKVRDAAHTTLASLELKPGDVFYYLFDFGDDWWHRITVDSVDIRATPGRRYPVLVEKIGESPDQYFMDDVDE